MANYEDLIRELNSEQLAAVTADEGPILVLAGAGSGKTRVLTNRIVHLVKHNSVSPDSILAITFTNKAANEMKRRLWEFDCGAEMMHISTIHSFCAGVLRCEAGILERKTNFTIYTEEEKKSVLKKVVREIMDDSDGKDVDKYSETISQLKNNASAGTGMLDVFESVSDESAKTDDSEKKQDAEADALIKIVKEYTKKMSENNAMDFDDLLYYVHKLFSKFPEVLEHYRERYRYVLIDEFQDTNKVQYEIFRMLASKYRNIFAVGDDDQSIYSWRGADVGNILNFDKDFPEVKTFKLERNYRSTKRILTAANEIICKNLHRYGKTLWTNNPDGVKVQLFSAYNEQDEAYFVTEQIKALKYNHGYKLKDCAILMRISALSRPFEQELTRSRLPYKVFGGFKFYERMEIKDVLSYMRLIDNPYDNEAFLRAINVPLRRGIGETTLNRLSELSADYGLPLIEVISDERNIESLTSSARKKLLDFYALYKDLSELALSFGLTEFVHKLIDITEFRTVYLNRDEEERAINIDEFEQSVAEFEKSFRGAHLADYLESVSLSADIDREDDYDYVTIATVHAVKGLEYKAVFVAGMEEGLFPSSRTSYSLRDSEEERRLMYVAATRAKERLYLTRASTRFLYGQRKPMMASKFFSEINDSINPPKPYIPPDGSEDKPHFRPADRPKFTAGKNDEEVKKYRTGQIVEHESFGRGIILRCENGIADVVFDNCGKKSLNLKFAPLKIAEK